jgi:hypothetical protein
MASITTQNIAAASAVIVTQAKVTISNLPSSPASKTSLTSAQLASAARTTLESATVAPDGGPKTRNTGVVKKIVHSAFESQPQPDEKTSETLNRSLLNGTGRRVNRVA